MDSEELSNFKHPDQLFVKFLIESVELDLKSTTHPIQVEVNHTIDAVNAFDDICYEKGASFIKVLQNFIGKDAFKSGVKEYFARYQYSCTVMEEFIECLQKGMIKSEVNS